MWPVRNAPGRPSTEVLNVAGSTAGVRVTASLGHLGAVCAEKLERTKNELTAQAYLILLRFADTTLHDRGKTLYQKKDDNLLKAGKMISTF